jgi:signal peptidase I
MPHMTRPADLRRWLPLLRFGLDAARIGGLALAAVLIALLHLGPHIGLEPVVIRGASMEPSIPLGSLVILIERDPTSVRAGDVITRRTESGVLVTHRVIRVAEIDRVPHFETKGDASAAADPVLAAPDDVAGTVMLSVPVAGYLLAFLSHPLGMLSAVALLLGLTVAVELVEDLERSHTDRRPARPGHVTA